MARLIRLPGRGFQFIWQKTLDVIYWFTAGVNVRGEGDAKNGSYVDAVDEHGYDGTKYKIQTIKESCDILGDRTTYIFTVLANSKVDVVLLLLIISN